MKRQFFVFNSHHSRKKQEVKETNQPLQNLIHHGIDGVFQFNKQFFYNKKISRIGWKKTSKEEVKKLLLQIANDSTP